MQTMLTPSGGCGAAMMHLSPSCEDDAFHDGADTTQFMQTFDKYTPHHAAVVVQPVNNSGPGKTGSANLIKTPDLLFKTHVWIARAGIEPNPEAGPIEQSYVNALGFFVHKSVALKVGAQTIVALDGLTMLVLAELTGLLHQYAENVGLCYSRAELIAHSRRPAHLFVPLVGMPFHDRADLTFWVGTLAYHNASLELSARDANQLVVTYGMPARGRGMYAIPREVGSGAPFGDSSLRLALATQCVWLGRRERALLLKSYKEQIFTEYVPVGQSAVAPSSHAHRHNIEVSVKGPVRFFFVKVRSVDDLQAGNWLKSCDDAGRDYLREMMLYTGSTAVEDPLPASVYRTLKVTDAFGTESWLYTYVLPFETDARSRQMTGHMNATNLERLTLALVFNAHSRPLVVDSVFAVYNGVYGERGNIGKLWA